MQRACPILSSLRFYDIFLHYLIHALFSKKVIEHKMCVLIFSKLLSEISHSKKK